MKAGRPIYHIPAKWLTVKMAQRLVFFELDKKGILTSRAAEPHHIVRDSSTFLPEPIVQRNPIPPPIAVEPPTVVTKTPIFEDAEGFDSDDDWGFLDE
jgi:hypothetical protein